MGGCARTYLQKYQQGKCLKVMSCGGGEVVNVLYTSHACLNPIKPMVIYDRKLRL